jgi:hypothetical protein
LAEGAFDKHAQFADLSAVGLAEPMMPAFAGGGCFHRSKYNTLAIQSNKKSIPKNLFLLRDEKHTTALRLRAPKPLQYAEEFLIWNR